MTHTCLLYTSYAAPLAPLAREQRLYDRPGPVVDVVAVVGGIFQGGFPFFAYTSTIVSHLVTTVPRAS